MIKKYVFFLVIYILIIALAGCSSSTSKQISESNSNISVPNPDTTTQSSVDGVTPENGDVMRVLWTVSGYVIGEGSAWGEQDAKAILFKPLDMTDTEITFDGHTCKNVEFQREMVDAAEYLSRVWKTTPQALGLKDQKLQAVKTDCALPAFQNYIRLNDGSLIVPINGVFFFFEPAVNR